MDDVGDETILAALALDDAKSTGDSLVSKAWQTRRTFDALQGGKLASGPEEKKPAGEEEKEKDSEVEASAEEAEDEPEESERKEEKKKAQQQEFPVGGRNYCILYYQKDNRIGMRQCFGNRRQVFSFGGKSCEKSEEALRAIGREAAERLKGGMSEGDCAVWCREQAGA